MIFNKLVEIDNETFDTESSSFLSETLVNDTIAVNAAAGTSFHFYMATITSLLTGLIIGILC